MSFYSLVEILYYLFTCRYNNRTKEEGSKGSSFYIEQRITIEIFFLVEDNYRDANIIWYAACVGVPNFGLPLLKGKRGGTKGHQFSYPLFKMYKKNVRISIVNHF